VVRQRAQALAARKARLGQELARLLLAPLIVGLGGGDPNEALVWRDQSLAAPLAAPGPRETFCARA